MPWAILCHGQFSACSLEASIPMSPCSARHLQVTLSSTLEALHFPFLTALFLSTHLNLSSSVSFNNILISHLIRRRLFIVRVFLSSHIFVTDHLILFSATFSKRAYSHSNISFSTNVKSLFRRLRISTSASLKFS